MAPIESKGDQEKDVIYVINKYDNFTTYNWRSKRFVFPYNVPVPVDFTNDPDLVSNLLQCPQLQVCTKRELAAYRAREQAKAAIRKVEPDEVVQQDSETEKLLKEDTDE